MPCDAIPYHTIPYHTIPYFTILYYTILYYTILYYTILYYTILYYTLTNLVVQTVLLSTHKIVFVHTRKPILKIIFMECFDTAFLKGKKSSGSIYTERNFTEIVKAVEMIIIIDYFLAGGIQSENEMFSKCGNSFSISRLPSHWPIIKGVFA